MNTQSAEPVYSGMDKYPGIISTVVTIIVGAIFLGALYVSATSGDHGGGHGEAHATEHAAEGGDHGGGEHAGDAGH